MDDSTKRQFYGAGLLIAYGFVVICAKNALEDVNDNFDGAVALVQAITGATGSAAYIDLNPTTVVDKQKFNLDADRRARGFHSENV